MSKKSKSIPNPYARRIALASRVNVQEMQMAISKAQKYTGGNLSVLVRKAVLEYKSEGKKK